MILWFEGRIKQAIGHMAELAFPGRSGKYSPLVAALTLQILMGAAQFKAGFKVIEAGFLGPDLRCHHEPEQSQAYRQRETS